ncbi:MAG: hypothetical protein JST87_00320 [Bacteroidetes bacterium]|nr:hypothetical protein [Bacteroidota bacterium]MBS1936046.1 hypothetical protein [Bacteroidota bacterium]
MKKIPTIIAVSLIMIIAILGITNPGRYPYRMFDHVEGKLTNNYFIFSIYKQNSGFAVSADGKYHVYRRFIGIAGDFYEISPEKIKAE